MPRRVISPRDLILLMRSGQRSGHYDVPDISADDISDISKANLVQKVLLCAQMLFFCASCAVRVNQHLPLTLLEITTISHSLCALASLILWWYKPQDAAYRVQLSEVPISDDDQEHITGLDDKPPKIMLYLTGVIIAALHGLPHILGFNAQFPTPAEQMLWRVASVVVIAAPVVTIPALGGRLKGGETPSTLR